MKRELKDIEIRYKLGHTRNSTWEREMGMYCSNCGTKDSVWSELGEGDYYQGNEYICLDCGATGMEPRMTVYNGPSQERNSQKLQKLREARIR